MTTTELYAAPAAAIARRTMRRFLAYGMVLVLIMTSLTACSAQPIGVIGIGRDQQGTLLVYLRSCHYPIPGVKLFDQAYFGGADFGEDQILAEWRITADSTESTVVWPLFGDSPPAVVAEKRIDALPAIVMDIRGWTSSGDRYAGGPYNLTAADLEELKPGEVLVEYLGGLDRPAPNNRTYPPEQMDRLACESYPDKW